MRRAGWGQRESRRPSWRKGYRTILPAQSDSKCTHYPEAEALCSPANSRTSGIGSPSGWLYLLLTQLYRWPPSSVPEQIPPNHIGQRKSNLQSSWHEHRTGAVSDGPIESTPFTNIHCAVPQPLSSLGILPFTSMAVIPISFLPSPNLGYLTEKDPSCSEPHRQENVCSFMHNRKASGLLVNCVPFTARGAALASPPAGSLSYFLQTNSLVVRVAII